MSLRRENDSLQSYVDCLEDTIDDQKVKMKRGNCKCKCKRKVVCACDPPEDCTITVSIQGEDLERECSRREQLLRKIDFLESEVRFREDMLRLQKKRCPNPPSIDIVVEDKASGCNEYILRMTSKFHKQLDIGADLDRLEREVERLVELSKAQPEIVINIEEEECPPRAMLVI